MPADARRARDRERAADRRRADRALRDRGGEVARADLARVGAEARELASREPDDDLAVEHADRRGHRAGRAHLPLRLEPDLDALARREAVRDERRLERDDGARLAHLVGDRGSRRPLHLDEAAPALVLGAPRGSRRADMRGGRARSTRRPRAGTACGRHSSVA